MNVLVLTKYDTIAASVRQRFLAYSSCLAERGIFLSHYPLLDNDYLERTFRGERALASVIAGYARRVATLFSAKKWDLIVIQYELFPYLPPWFEAVLFKAGIRYVVDYDDAIFHTYDDHQSGIVRGLLSDKIGRVMAGARAVITGSEYLAAYARCHNERVYIVPTVVDLEAYQVKHWSIQANEPFTVGWIGSPSTAPYLELTRKSLSNIGRESRTRLIVIGGKMAPTEHLEIAEYLWSEEKEVELLLKCDVGIMPLSDDKWARGKCAFKLIQYMACGLPTVASPVGENRNVISKETGILARSSEEWTDALRFLRDRPEARRALGAAGRQKCAASYSLQSQVERLAAILRKASTEGSHRSLE